MPVQSTHLQLYHKSLVKMGFIKAMLTQLIYKTVKMTALCTELTPAKT